MKKCLKEIKIICQQTSFLSKVKTCANFSCHLQSNSNVINFKMEGKNQLVYRACPPRGGEGSLRWADNLTNSMLHCTFHKLQHSSSRNCDCTQPIHVLCLTNPVNHCAIGKLSKHKHFGMFYIPWEVQHHSNHLTLHAGDTNIKILFKMSKSTLQCVYWFDLHFIVSWGSRQAQITQNCCVTRMQFISHSKFNNKIKWIGCYVIG